MSLQTTVKYYKKAKSIYNEIDQKYYDLQSKKSEESEFKINQMINRLKEFKKYLRYVDVNDLQDHYSDETINNVTHNVELFHDALYYWERFFLQAKYAKDLLEPLMHKYIKDLNLGEEEIENWGGSIESVARKFITAVTNPDNIIEYEKAIRRMALGTMTQKEFNRIFDVVKHKLVVTKKKLKFESMKIPTSLEEYQEMNEDFFNPFDEKDLDKKAKSTRIKDSGGPLSLRKETFNLARVEFTKRPGGEYTILAKTQFARGEIVEICPTIIVGEEAKTINGIKDIIFEIDREQNQWALVLGYGSLYKHSDKPNVEYAFNKLTKQMYFITKEAIRHGDELTINYGQDYWMERMTFNTMADMEKANSENNQGMPTSGKVITKDDKDLDESEVQPNAADIKNTTTIKQISSPNNPNNPVRSGVAIIGTGQQ